MRRVVFISGRGSNMASLFSDQDDFKIDLVITNSESALGIGRARRQGIPVYIDNRLNKKNSEAWRALADFLNTRGFAQAILLGFMRIVPPGFIQGFKGEIINLHPSLLPAFKGLEAIEKSYSEGAPMGVSVHHVTEELDSGEVLAQGRLKTPQIANRYALTLSKVQFLISILEQRTVIQALRQRPAGRSVGV